MEEPFCHQLGEFFVSRNAPAPAPRRGKSWVLNEVAQPLCSAVPAPFNCNFTAIGISEAVTLALQPGVSQLEQRELLLFPSCTVDVMNQRGLHQQHVLSCALLFHTFNYEPAGADSGGARPALYLLMSKVAGLLFRRASAVRERSVN